MHYATQETDLLIIGAGGAGLFAALHAHQTQPELSITIAIKGLLGKCGCTRMVQGGYNVALAAGDSIQRHFMDTIEGGKWLPHQALAWKLCETAVSRVHQLENELGCFFDRNPDGSLHSKAFAGQSFDRTVHKGDLTGIEIVNRLMEQVRRIPIQRLQEHRALALVPSVNKDCIAGVLLLDMRSGRFLLVRAKAVLLATGGGPTMYKFHTPSGDKSMDGLAMAFNAGLPLRDMEMVQFHPTGLLAGPHTRMTGTVLEEGLRGAGGYLINGHGERFMPGYDPKAERATRDVVSRAIYSEIRKGYETENGGVFIDMRHLGGATVRQIFPGMVARCHDCGFDLAEGQVEVVPTAHYHMGGVVCDVDTSTALPGLFVAGEDAGGVHGANRLGGNGVANSTVFGGIAGETMAQWAICGEFARVDLTLVEHAVDAAHRPFKCPVGDFYALRDQLMEIMWRNVGVLRQHDALQQARHQLNELAEALDNSGLGKVDKHFNLAWHDWLNLRNLIQVSQIITDAALHRENSRGAHFREDFPDPGSLKDSYFTVAKQGNNGLEIRAEQVDFSIVKPGHSVLANDTA